MISALPEPGEASMPQPALLNQNNALQTGLCAQRSNLPKLPTTHNANISKISSNYASASQTTKVNNDEFDAGGHTVGYAECDASL